MEECLTVLQQASIPYRIATTAPIFEISSIGSGGANNDAMVMVPTDQLSAARSAMLEDARQTIQQTPPMADDYLATLDAATLEQMLREPAGWSFHDLAVAEFLVGQRGGSVPEISFPDPTAPPKNYAPVRANWLLISFGLLTTGGIFGFIFSWSLIHSRQHGDDSPYHYDQVSRSMGYIIFAIALLLTVSMVCLILDAIFGGLLLGSAGPR